MALTDFTLPNKYRRKDLTSTDVTNLIAVYTDLKASVGVYVFNNMTNEELVNLSGTIPVRYRGILYNIPVQVWLYDTHPYNPPICYVRPTSSMRINAGKHVDANGLVYLPYLHEWTVPTSNLLGLIQQMIVVFEAAPPVFSCTTDISMAPTSVARPSVSPSSSVTWPSVNSSFVTRPSVSPPSVTWPSVTPPSVGRIYKNYPHKPCDLAAKLPRAKQKPATVTAAGDDNEKEAVSETELKRLQEQHTCKVCLDKEVSIVFVPCGHLVTCKDCATSLSTCPICRAVVKEAVRIFML